MKADKEYNKKNIFYRGGFYYLQKNDRSLRADSQENGAH